MQECFFYKKLDKEKVKCEACNHFCVINKNEVGICGVRKNLGGKLYSIIYGKIISLNIDRIEKKPIYHFLPGSKTFSMGTLGCNFSCLNCQNHEISQIYGFKGDLDKYDKIDWGYEILPKEIVAKAIWNNCPSISYTYNEPTVFLEYAFDTMKIAQEKNLKNIWVSNGYMSSLVLDKIIPYLDAINVDLKSFNDNFYKKYCGGSLKPVLKNLKKLSKSRTHLEVTTLVIPGLNDDEKELENIVDFIKRELGDETPWHISAFSPYLSWRLKEAPFTSPELIYKAQDMALKKGLRNVYVGNI